MVEEGQRSEGSGILKAVECLSLGSFSTGGRKKLGKT